MEIVRAAISLLLALVILGIIFVWIMMPTAAYNNEWSPNFQTTVNSTYFGAQGANMLLVSFPVLFVAFLGSVYLHLGNKLSDSKKQRKWIKNLPLWHRPVIVKGSLGIVSILELALFVMFIALLVWSLANYISVNFAPINPKSAAHQGLTVWQYKLHQAAFALSLTGNVALAFLFYPVARGSSVLPLFGVTFEASIKYHIWLGHLVVILFTAHSVCFLSCWGAAKQTFKMRKWQSHTIAHVPGEISLLILLAMWATSISSIRRKMFELFYHAHHLYFPLIIFFIFHVGFPYACITLPGFFIFLIDRFLRFLQSRRNVRLTSARIFPCQTVELNFSKSQGLNFNPTSTIFVNVPSISKLQWHPFTVSSSSNLDPENLSLVIKGDGNWTTKLYNLISSPSSADHLEVSIEGPYGPASTDFLRHDTLVMVSGGSGITPFISIIRELIFTSAKVDSKVPHLILIASFKTSSELTMLDLILPASGAHYDLSKLQLQIEAFVTTEKEPGNEENKVVRDVRFTPRPTDAPISAVLGPNTWIWLGAILASSFVIFLIVTGIITRYYIFPIDHNTGAIFSWTLEGVLFILVVCLSIATTASAAVLWNKKQNAMEPREIQNTGTPNVSSTERELESVPYLSLAQVTNVHYGERPNLKKMLFEIKESSVGVLVCGPTKMANEVAAICGSGLADNLHFKSFSFSW